MARTLGAKNKIPQAAKENIAAVFVRLGGTAQMAQWAKNNQTEFYKLYSRLIPVEQRVGGSDDAPPIQGEVIWRVVDPRNTGSAKTS